jgi:hypothetical protein
MKMLADEVRFSTVYDGCSLTGRAWLRIDCDTQIARDVSEREPHG